MACLRHLLVNDRHREIDWKYFITTAGSELPLKSENWTRMALMQLPKAHWITSEFGRLWLTLTQTLSADNKKTSCVNRGPTESAGPCHGKGR